MARHAASPGCGLETWMVGKQTSVNKTAEPGSNKLGSIKITSSIKDLHVIYLDHFPRSSRL